MVLPEAVPPATPMKKGWLRWNLLERERGLSGVPPSDALSEGACFSTSSRRPLTCLTGASASAELSTIQSQSHCL